MSSKNSNADIWIAGAVAAFSIDLLFYPLDTIKTRLQSPDYHKLYTHGVEKGANRALFRGVYQGIGSVIVATLPSSGAFFTTYEGVKSVLTQHNPAPSGKALLPQPLVHAAASATAELVSCAILTPAEVIKQNAQMVDNSKADRPRVNATLEVMKRFQNNPLALWRGYTALASRNLPFTALQFPMFERIRESIKRWRRDKGIKSETLYENGMITAVSAGSAGSVAAVITTPIDVVKTRIMLAATKDAAEEAGHKSKPAKDTLVDATGKTLQATKDNIKAGINNISKPPSSQTSMQIAREIINEHGAKGLFRGGALRGVWTMLGSGLYLGVYESMRIYLAQRRGEKLDEKDLM